MLGVNLLSVMQLLHLFNHLGEIELSCLVISMSLQNNIGIRFGKPLA